MTSHKLRPARAHRGARILGGLAALILNPPMGYRQGGFDGSCG